METTILIMPYELKHNTICRICGGSNLTKILDLGMMPLANSFIKKEDLGKPEKKFPLTVYFCETCSLLQLLDVVNPELIFINYDYLTSASQPLVQHFVKMASDLLTRFAVQKNDLVMEIGGNDGALLSAIKGQCRVLNIEPAKNIAEISKKNGIETYNQFFGSKAAEDILKTYGNAKLVVANNVMAHIDDIRDIFSGVKTLIGENGVFVFEVHWVGNLITEGGFDQIYHEHLCYHSLHDLKYLVENMGLKVIDIQTVPIHGESMRVFVSKNIPATPNVSDFLQREKSLGLNDKDTFLRFAKRVQESKQILRNMLSMIKNDGKKIAGYGAPAKGNTLLNYYGITPDIVDRLTDTTPLKQGLYAPGTKIPVVHPDSVRETPPDYFLLLAWNYADAILKKEEDLRKRGVKFIIPVPAPRIV